ncbi:MAG TPA: cation:proton antiporter, partial [Terrimicrobiaceae bacterium]
MHQTSFLQDLATVMAVAALATLIFRQLKQPVVLGYILAGVIIGPHTPPFSLIADEHAIETLAELGIIFLMFALGLEFSLRKLKEVGATALIAASLEILLMILAGYALGRAFGWNKMDSIFLGAILSISSTTIIIKALEGLEKTRERFANLIFGILIVEDILAIVLIALLSGFARTGELEAEAIGMTVLNLGAFLGILLVVGLILVPRLLNYVARFKSDEMLLVTVVGLCFGVALITSKLGYSVALGAFLIGAIIAEARQIYKIETLMHPVRDLFSAVFFVSIGMLIHPALLAKYALPILAITVVVVLGKVFTCSLGTFIAGNDMRTSLRVGMGLAQIGEFSFIIASLGLTLNVTSEFIYPIAVAVSSLTTLLTPYLIRSSDALVEWFDRVAPKPLLEAIDAYSERVGNLGRQNGARIERKIIAKLGGQIAINLLLITGIFIGAVFLHRIIQSRWPEFPGGIQGIKAATWLTALLVSFPLLVAVWRKIEAGAMLIAETAVGLDKAGSKDSALQGVISSTILVFGTGLLIVLVVILSSTLLPSGNVLILTLLIMAISGFVLYRGAVKLYSRAQSALRDTFAQPADPPLLKETPSLPPLLREARLETVEVPLGAQATGKMIAELKLR